MKKNLLAGLSLLFLASCSSSRYYFKEGVDKTYNSEFGNVDITDSVIENINDKVKVKFTINNKTQKPILGGKILFNLLDEYGLKINDELLEIDFDKTIDSNNSTWVGSMFSIAKKDKIKNFEIKKIAFRYLALYNLSLNKPIKSKESVFEDNNIKISFFWSYSSINFELNNKTDEPIEINWNKISYVDINNKSDKIFHSEVKYSERSNEMPESIIPPQASIKDSIVPISNVSFVEGSKYSSAFWKEDNLLPIVYNESLKTKTIGLFIPLKINGAIKNYNFVFNINASK